MIRVETETHPPEPIEDDDGEDRPLLSIRVWVTELDETMHEAGTMLHEETGTPDAVAEAILRCALGIAQQRGPDTLIALQQRLTVWGQT